MRQFMLMMVKAPIYFYRWALSPLLGPRCRFYPTCSAYMMEALEKHGILKGLFLGMCRLGRCHPWCRTHWHDPVPKRFTWGRIFGYKRGTKTTPC